MESKILDRSNSYLKIFCDSFEIDYNLPKWSIINKSKNKALNNDVANADDIDDDMDMRIDLNSFDNMNAEDFNIYLGKKVAENTFVKFGHPFGVINVAVDGNANNSKPKFIRLVEKIYNKFSNKDKEEVYEFNILEFFAQIKDITKESKQKYINRIEPYMIALKDAKDMGQQGLVDKLTEEIFINKYESLLYAAGYYYKLKEEQVVKFVKRAEKGVQICYVKNFGRPIPRNIIEIKKKVDELNIFDNYCIMYYEGDIDANLSTADEREREREKKADPILFGMISGSRNLYYVADWVDEYCDLTLDEYLKVSGIDKEHIKIDEKIKL